MIPTFGTAACVAIQCYLLLDGKGGRSLRSALSMVGSAIFVKPPESRALISRIGFAGIHVTMIDEALRSCIRKTLFRLLG